MKQAKRILKSGIAALAAKTLANTTIQQQIFNAIRLDRIEFDRLWRQDEIRFLSHAFGMRALSRSQILQDLWVSFELDGRRDGFFVEFGATDGLLNSNTWLLEKHYGWRGLLAEPNPFWHEALAANRRGASIEHRCVSPRSGERVAFIATNDSDPELSGIAGYSAGDHFAGQRERGRSIEIETISLDDLLDEHHAPESIDYISIDTEGSELDILSAFDFTKRRFSLLSIEQNDETGPGIEELLSRNGYSRVFPQFSQWDGWYVAEELRRRAEPRIVAPAA